MKIELTRKNQAFNFEAMNEKGHTLSIDAGPSVGGSDLGFRSMELLLAGIAGCSSIDILLILKKQKQTVTDYKVVVTGERDQNAVTAVFKHIHLEFHIGGDLNLNKLERAVSLSVEKYCSVARMLEKTAEITWRINMN